MNNCLDLFSVFLLSNLSDFLPAKRTFLQSISSSMKSTVEEILTYAPTAATPSQSLRWRTTLSQSTCRWETSLLWSCSFLGESISWGLSALGHLQVQDEDGEQPPEGSRGWWILLLNPWGMLWCFTDYSSAFLSAWIAAWGLCILYWVMLLNSISGRRDWKLPWSPGATQGFISKEYLW